MEKRFPRYPLLALAVLLTLLSGLPTADVPVKVWDSAAAMVQVFAVLAVTASWLYLAVSGRRKRDYCIACGLNLLVVVFLCRALNDIGQCYEYYLYGGG